MVVFVTVCYEVCRTGSISHTQLFGAKCLISTWFKVAIKKTLCIYFIRNFLAIRSCKIHCMGGGGGEGAKAWHCMGPIARDYIPNQFFFSWVNCLHSRHMIPEIFAVRRFYTRIIFNTKNSPNYGISILSFLTLELIHTVLPYTAKVQHWTGTPYR